MTPSPRKPHRYGGLQVRICGRKINSAANIVCQQPPGKHSTHTAIAVGDGEEGIKIFAFIMDEAGDVQTWQLTEE